MTFTFIPLRAMVITTHMQTFGVSGQSVLKTEWKQMDGRTDRRTNGRMEVIALPAALMQCATTLGCRAFSLLIPKLLPHYVKVR